MNNQTRDFVRNRAQALFPIIRDQLNNEYELNEEWGHAFKLCFLLLKGPREYFRNFEEGLVINIPDVDDIFMQLEEYLPGPSGLTIAEKEILKHHNDECKKYYQEHPTVLPFHNDGRTSTALHY